MQHNRILRAAVLCCAVQFSSAAVHAAVPQDIPAIGFVSDDLPYPGQHLTATLGNGDILAFDGLVVGLYDESGNHLSDLVRLPSFVFGSFLIVSEDESIAVLGESTNHDLLRIDLVAGGFTYLTNLVFNYAADFEDADEIIVSAATCGFGCGNQIYRVDTTSGATTLIANVGGASGPVAVESGGDLVYGRVSDTFGLGEHSVLRFSASDLTGSPLGTELDAAIVGTGFDGAGSLVIDPGTGDIYLAANDFFSGINRIRRVEGNASQSPIVLEGENGFTICNLEFRNGVGEASFRGYQPKEGGALLYNSTDFGVLQARRELVPLRPFLALSGPGTVGPGPLTTGVAGGSPLGFSILLYGPTALFDPEESSIPLAALEAPLFAGLDFATLTIDQNVLALDANGVGSLVYPTDGSLLGLVTAQALIFDSSFKPVQISSAASL